jgi:uncharacterized repeat protein (TIGR03987 family)
VSTILVFATTTITLALVFYTFGVWGERKANTLKKWHVATFWMGLVCDTTGTLTMERIAKSGVVSISTIASTIHGITGILAIALMVFHAIWATTVLVKSDDEKKQNFHRFSVIVWTIWLIPYFIGMFIGMMQ